eukprot:TRINITY_DN1801_c0_g1_i10.p1 TRINITY_DN1801_c0_g1~~TRINITY_DN1801_c0_g1_i10.p1  ORF type:complete len:505 (+),score=42.34 TRINITY_DN1801_c0_g1_i10:697-2211(+)
MSGHGVNAVPIELATDGAPVSIGNSGIKAFGAYIPRRRLQRAAIAAAHSWAFPNLKAFSRGERAMCAWDEDAITMAVEAGRDCLSSRGTAVRAITFASTSAPYSDLNCGAFVAAALSLGTEISARDVGGSTRAGLTAIIDACNSNRDGEQLIIASEKRTAKPGSTLEMQVGCGAASVSVGTGDDLIARYLGSHSVSIPFIDHFRKASQSYDYSWEERWIRDEGVSKVVPQTISELLKTLNRESSEIAHFSVSGGPIGSDKLVAKALGIDPSKVLSDLQGQIGDLGAAQPIMQLVSAFERAKAGDLVLIANFGQGCEIVAFEVLKESHPVKGRRGFAGSVADRIEESAYLKLLSFDGSLDLDWGMRAETDNKTALTQLYRASDQILGFVGGRCEACSTVQFPRLPACVNCGSVNTQSPYPLSSESAKVATYTADWLQYSPSPPLYMGLVQFDCGARVLMEIVDVGPDGLSVGSPLSMTFRIKERDRLRGYDRYFWKAIPVRAASH